MTRGRSRMCSVQSMAWAALGASGPPAPVGTVCRLRCVLDRTGRLLDAGLEAESQTPAFDRAALRAVYASAPFPPLPEGFGGSTLTLHLEFGQ